MQTIETMFDQIGCTGKYLYRKYVKSQLSGKLTQKRKNATDLLRLKISKLQENELNGDTSCDVAWIKNKRILRKQVLESDPNFFLEWEVIQETMFHTPDISELKFLQESANWPEIKKAINESPVGNPPYLHYYPCSSGNLVHHAYSIINFLNFYKTNLRDIPGDVIEFGGGYGSFCRLIFNLGFSGCYTIFDQPEFSVLQEFYLKNVNNNISINQGEPRTSDKSVDLISDLNDLNLFFSRKNKLGIFIALWSLSECPIEFRSEFLNEKCKPEYFLISYQEKFGNIDNVKYFDECILKNTDYLWDKIKIEHLPGNYYLFGKKI